MAIFTNQADAKLPALTQFYQLDFSPQHNELGKAYGRRLLNTPAGEELRLWVAKVTGVDEVAHGGKIPSIFPASNPADPWDSGEGFMAWLAELHFFLCQMMAHAADGSVPAQSQVEHLNELLAKYAPPQIVWKSGMEMSRRPGVQIALPAQDFTYPDFWDLPPFTGTMESLEKFVGRILLREFYQALTCHQLARCITCRSVFWRTHAKAENCSRRCTGRVTQRRWREAKITK